MNIIATIERTNTGWVTQRSRALTCMSLLCPQFEQASLLILLSIHFAPGLYTFPDYSWAAETLRSFRLDENSALVLVVAITMKISGHRAAVESKQMTEFRHVPPRMGLSLVYYM